MDSWLPGGGYHSGSTHSCLWVGYFWTRLFGKVIGTGSVSQADGNPRKRWCRSRYRKWRNGASRWVGPEPGRDASQLGVWGFWKTTTRNRYGSEMYCV
jgi:hypothetical protein